METAILFHIYQRNQLFLTYLYYVLYDQKYIYKNLNIVVTHWSWQQTKLEYHDDQNPVPTSKLLQCNSCVYNNNNTNIPVVKS